MRRRRLLLRVRVLALLGVAGLLLFLRITTPPSGISRENFRRLYVGMTELEVEAILGKPGTKLPWTMDPPGGTVKAWRTPSGPDFKIFLGFDDQGKVLWGDAGARDLDESLNDGILPRLSRLFGR